MTRKVEPLVIRHIADAIADLHKARDKTTCGSVEDHITNAIEQLVLAIECSMLGENDDRE